MRSTACNRRFSAQRPLSAYRRRAYPSKTPPAPNSKSDAIPGSGTIRMLLTYVPVAMVGSVGVLKKVNSSQLIGPEPAKRRREIRLPPPNLVARHAILAW
jgi:hypothetical protein